MSMPSNVSFWGARPAYWMALGAIAFIGALIHVANSIGGAA